MGKGKRSLHVVVFAGVAVSAAFAVYCSALWNDFVWDDHIVLKSQVVAFHSVKDLFFPPEGIQQLSLHYYRPLVVASYLIDKTLWGESAFGFHLSVILMHLLSTLLVFIVSRVMLKGLEHRDLGALIASLVFAVHPIHTESVSWMAGRSDVIAAVFFFLSLFFYLKYREDLKRTRLAFSATFFLLAALGKETGLSMILLLPVIDILFYSDKSSLAGKKSHEKRKLRQAINVFRYIPFLISTIVYLVLRHYALRGGIQKSLQTGDLLENLKILINSYGFYFKKIFFPVHLNAVIQEVPSGTGITVISLILIAVLLGGMILSYVKKQRIAVFCISFFIVTLIPSIIVAVLEVSETPLAERYLYIPSYSFSLFIAFVFLSIPARLKRSPHAAAITRIILMVLVFILLLVFSAQTIKRNTVWKDDILFWKDLVRKGRGEGYPHLQLGIAYAKRGSTTEAEQEYKQAIASEFDDEGRAVAWNNLGNIYLERKDFLGAEKCFAEAISLWRSYPTPYYSRALSYWRRMLKNHWEDGEADPRLIEDAIVDLNNAIRLNPQYTKAHGLLGELYFRMGRYAEAKRHLQAAIRYEYDKEGITAKGAKKLLEKIPAP